MEQFLKMLGHTQSPSRTPEATPEAAQPATANSPTATAKPVTDPAAAAAMAEAFATELRQDGCAAHALAPAGPDPSEAMMPFRDANAKSEVVTTATETGNMAGPEQATSLSSATPADRQHPAQSTANIPEITPAWTVEDACSTSSSMVTGTGRAADPPWKIQASGKAALKAAPGNSRTGMATAVSGSGSGSDTCPRSVAVSPGPSSSSLSSSNGCSGNASDLPKALSGNSSTTSMRGLHFKPAASCPSAAADVTTTSVVLPSSAAAPGSVHASKGKNSTFNTAPPTNKDPAVSPSPAVPVIAATAAAAAAVAAALATSASRTDDLHTAAKAAAAAGLHHSLEVVVLEGPPGAILGSQQAGSNASAGKAKNGSGLRNLNWLRPNRTSKVHGEGKGSTIDSTAVGMAGAAVTGPGNGGGRNARGGGGAGEQDRVRVLVTYNFKWVYKV